MKTITAVQALEEGLTITKRTIQHTSWPQCKFQQWERVTDLARIAGLDRTTIMEAIHRGKIPRAAQAPWRVEMGYFTTWWLQTYRGRGLPNYRWSREELSRLKAGDRALPARTRAACKIKLLRTRRKERRA